MTYLWYCFTSLWKYCTCKIFWLLWDLFLSAFGIEDIGSPRIQNAGFGLDCGFNRRAPKSLSGGNCLPLSGGVNSVCQLQNFFDAAVLLRNEHILHPNLERW